MGVNSRLTNLQAGITRVKLQHLEAYHRFRQEAATWYDARLSGMEGLQVPVRSAFSTHIFHQYTLVVRPEARDQLKKYLGDRGIPSQVYYPLPLHLQRAYQDLGYREGDLPVSEELSRKVLSLPMHTELDQEQLTYITDQIQQFYKI